jgi:hypothetical protein
MFEKIGKIVDALGEKRVKFAVRRTEPVENKNDFVALHEKYGVKCKIGQNSSNSYGSLEKEAFLNFLKEFDKKYDLGTTLIDLESVVINPLFL